MKKIILFLCTFLIQTGFCQVCANEYTRHGGDIVNRNFSLTTPFKIDATGLVLIPVSLKDTVIDFVFDTASSLSIIDKKFYDKFNANILGKVDVFDANGVRDSLNAIDYDSCRIGDLNLLKVPFAISDMEKVVKGAGGILGVNIINKLNWYFDYDSLSLTITDKEIKKDSAITEIRYKYNEHNIPVTSLKVGSEIIGDFKIDYGCNSTIEMPDSIFKKILPLRYSKTTSHIGSPLGLFGGSDTNIQSYVYLENLLKVDKFLVPFTRLYSHKRLYLLGQGFFSMYNVGIDSKNKCYYLFKRKTITYDSITEVKVFPMAFSFQNNKIMVSHNKICSKTDNYGINVGDELESINSKIVADFKSEDEFIEWYREEKALSIKFKKYDKPITVWKEKYNDN